MGYRSEVKILFTGQPEDLKSFIARAKLEMRDDYYDWPESSHIDNLYWLLEWNSVKWYDSYAHVQTWEALYQRTNDEDEPVKAEFLRIGEDDDDIEHRMTHDGDRNMWVSRQIEVDI